MTKIRILITIPGRCTQDFFLQKELFAGHPIFNDDVYGGDRIVKGTVFTKYKQFVENCFTICPRHALHAQQIGFIHPTSGMPMNFESELPEDMKAVIEKWKKYSLNRNLYD